MILTLLRDKDDGTCTLGTLVLGMGAAAKSWQALERPWIPDPAGAVGGLQGRSCVPVGVYELVLHDSEDHPGTWALVNDSLGVTHFGPSHREAVLIHSANYPNQLRGCIAPGLIRAKQSVLRSRDAVAELKAAMPWVNGHTIEIRNV